MRNAEFPLQAFAAQLAGWSHFRSINVLRVRVLALGVAGVDLRHRAHGGASPGVDAGQGSASTTSERRAAEDTS